MDAKTIAELNAGYQCPADAGPAWRAACEMGMDMSLIECNLDLTPWERLKQNDSALDLIYMLRRSNSALHGRTSLRLFTDCMMARSNLC
jgi:hypothetical protein